MSLSASAAAAASFSSSSTSTDPHAKDPLPPGWIRQYSKSQNRHFYFHKDTKHTQWHFPTQSEAKDPLKGKQRAEMNKERDEKKRELQHDDPSQRGGQQQTQRKDVVPTSSSLLSSSVLPEANKRARTDTTTKKEAAASSTSTSKNKSGDQQQQDDFLELADSTSVAIVVPFRDLHTEQKRAAHLRQFVPHMLHFLRKLKKDGLLSDYHIYIVEQSDDNRKFNRGKLLNIGYDLARKSGRNHDVFIFHDVDLLPQDDLGRWYAKFPTRPIHIARVWDRYSKNPKYFGGAVSFSSSDYKRINGYPNNFFGWGGEDDEMQRRLERLGIQFEAPDKGTLVDLEEMTLSEKLDFLRVHKEWKCMVKWELAAEHEKTWKTNGLADLKYAVLATTSLDDNQGKASKITVDVKLNGNHWTNEKSGVDYMEK